MPSAWRPSNSRIDIRSSEVILLLRVAVEDGASVSAGTGAAIGRGRPVDHGEARIDARDLPAMRRAGHGRHLRRQSRELDQAVVAVVAPVDDAAAAGRSVLEEQEAMADRVHLRHRRLQLDR